MNKDKEKNSESAGTWSIYSLFGISALIVILDRLSKYLSDTNLTEGVAVNVFPGFDLLLAYNRGASFSFLDDAGGWQRWLLTGISLGVSALITVWLIRLPKAQKLQALALALILGGALGNLYDRMMAGYVIDFISVYFMDARFAIFNIADAAISVGAGMMILDIFLDYKRGTAERTAS
ncbi:MAG: signal peptidase II [Gammaproteobacteria bacterium]|mgnify:FL=1|jgi:signal peptidase II|nr:signal peptidase II [Gammaproteobacteria bacterium]MBT6042819.1 signal peptidase II [Gammaproteobacteria bacterium]